MKISVDWLNSYLEQPLSTSDMAAAMERAGIEVEGIASAASFHPDIVVGQITEVQPHDDADKLVVAQVDVKSSTITIVTGAPNVTSEAVGAKVCVAQVGASLPDGTEMKVAKLRGIESHGMMCSEAELELGHNHEGIWFVPSDWQVGASLRDLIASSDVIDTTTSANRWDLNGVMWIAREIAAQTNQKVTFITPEHISSSPGPEIAVVAPELVDRYMLAEVALGQQAPTPTWMCERLQAAGIRSISLVVDITNYVMLETAQPLHAFDANKVQGEVSVRLAQSGEKLTTLDGIERELDPTDLMICDTTGPIGFAGVMGGRNSEMDAASTTIYLEAASFNGSSIRKTAIRHGLRTDASARFERRLPIDAAALALARACQLLVEHAGAEVKGTADHLQAPSRQTVIATRTQRINTVLGLELTSDQVAEQLRRLDWEIDTVSRPNELSLTVPWWRPDITHDDDVAEEVIKLIGYDQLPATLPAWRPHDMAFDRHWPPLWQIKSCLVGAGLFEIMSYSFISKEQITDFHRSPEHFLKLKNPLSTEQAYLRTDLLPSLVRVAERNRTYARQFGIFEISKTYVPRAAGELPAEPTRLGILVTAEDDAYFEAKAVLDRLGHELGLALRFEIGDVEPGVSNPTRSARILIGDEPAGWIGQLHPAVAERAKIDGQISYIELDVDLLVGAATAATYEATPKYPSITRDVSVVMDRQHSWQAVNDAVEQPITFVRDFYKDMPVDKKVMTLRLTVNYPDRTPTDKEADQAASTLVETLGSQFGAELQS